MQNATLKKVLQEEPDIKRNMILGFCYGFALFIPWTVWAFIVILAKFILGGMELEWTHIPPK